MFSVLTSKIYEFEDFRLVPDEGLLLHNGTPIGLNPKAFAVLVMIVEHHGHLVSKSEMLDTIWEGAFIEEGAIAKAVWFVRNALGDTSKERFIQTIPKRGYRFVAPVSVVENSGAFRLPELPGVADNDEELVSRAKKKALMNGSSTALVIPTGIGHQHGSESSSLMEVNPDRAHVNGNNNRNLKAASTAAVELPKATKRRKGLVRGSKFLLWGLGVWFVFKVILQALLIFGAMFVQYKDDLASRTANSTVEMMGGLLFMIQIPVGLGMFVGIGLFLFGSARMVYAVFEKEGSKTYSALIERVIVALITIAILAVVVPNLMFSYREASRTRQIKQISMGDKKSIAVLPLNPIDGANRNDLYEIGIAESLIHRLSAGKGIVVRSLSATRKYTEIDQDPLAAGREQKVDYVLASNYQLADDRIKVTSQLLDIATGKVEDTFTAVTDSANSFSAQDAIANDIGNRLLVRFGSPAVEIQAKRGTTNEEAYKFYLLAMNLSEERGAQNVLKSLEYFDRAVALDPNYARAWAGKALIHRDFVAIADSGQHEHYRRSMEAIGNALTIDPNLSEAYSALCHNKNRYEYDAAGAETACKRAVELDPNSPVAHKTYANFLYSRGSFDEAIVEIKTAMELQPVSYRNQQMYALTLYYARRYGEAEEQFKRLLELSPNHSHIHSRLIMVLEQQGNESEAFEYLVKKLTIQKEDEKLERFKTAYKTSGWRGVVIEQIKTAEADADPSYFQLACLYAKIGNIEKAFEYLEKAYQERSFLIAILQVEPQLDPLRGDPRFDELVKRVEGK